MTRFTDSQGMIIDVIRLSLTGGAELPGTHRSWQPGDGEWFRVKHSNGVLVDYVKTVDELSDLGVDVGSLTEKERKLRG